MKVAGIGCETMEMEFDSKVDPYAGLREENEKLLRELAAHKAELNALREEFNTVRRNAAEARSYLTGRISGLEFAVRCNGISGGEVRS